MPYQEKTEKENRTAILNCIVQGCNPNHEGSTFAEICETTDLSAPTVTKHLKRLLREGLIELDYDVESDRHEYVVANDKQRLMNLLRYFLELAKERGEESKAELERLRATVIQLEKDLAPFGKLPAEIRRLQEEGPPIIPLVVERVTDPSVPLAKARKKFFHEDD